MRRTLRRHSAQATVCAGMVLALAGIGWESHQTLVSEHDDQVDATFIAADRTAQQLATRTAEVFDQVNRSTLVVNYVQSHPAPPTLTELETAGVIDKGVADPMFVAGVTGFVLDSTTASNTQYVADEDFFKQHRRSTDRDVHVGPVWTDVITGHARVPVTRRLEANGRFSGVVAAMVDPQLLTVPYGRHEASGTVIGVLGVDGSYRSRTVDGHMTFGEHLEPALLARQIDTARRTREPARSTVDGHARFGAMVKVDRYPLYAVVALSAQEALAPYEQARRQVWRWGVAAAVGVLLAGGLLLWLARGLDHSRALTRRAESAFRATLDGSLDAVFILQAVRDGAGHLRDLRIVDCNDRAAGGLGASRGRVLGTLLGQHLPTQHALHLSAFEQVMTRRVPAQAELQAADAAVAGLWLHHQIVPLDDGVALISRDITETKRHEAALQALSRVDSLTGLANRRGFDEKLGDAMLRSARLQELGALGLLYIDLDGFKAINDTVGHAAGDTVLREVARRLKGIVRATDVVSRFGGDEFAVILENAGTAADVGALSHRIVEALSLPHELEGRDFVASPSVGVALYRPDEAAEAFCARADAAMYQAKAQGKARFVWAEGQGPEAAPGLRHVA